MSNQSSRGRDADTVEMRWRFISSDRTALSVTVSKVERRDGSEVREVELATIPLYFSDSKRKLTETFPAVVKQAEHLACASRLATGDKVRKSFDTSFCLSSFARTVYEEILNAPALHELRQAMTENSITILLRISAAQPELQGVPWELLGTGDIRMGTHPRLRVVREPVQSGLASSDREIRELSSDFMVALLVAISDPNALTKSALEEEFRAATADGSERPFGFPIPFRVESICQEYATPSNLPFSLERLRATLVHIVAHGRIANGKPQLQLYASPSGGAGGATAAWRSASEVAVHFAEKRIRLVILHSCLSGASTDPTLAPATEDPVALYSAAEEFLRSGIDAVVGFLCPMEAAEISEFLGHFYDTLLNPANGGDVAACMQKARRRYLFARRLYSAFAPVLFLGNCDPQLFDFQSLGVGPPPPRAPDSNQRPLVQELTALRERSAASRQSFMVILGSGSELPEDPATLKLHARLIELLTQIPALQLSPDQLRWIPIYSLAQLLSVSNGHGDLRGLLDQGLRPGSHSGPAIAPQPSYLDELGRYLCAGSHISFHLTPILELAAARHHPNRTIHVLMHPDKVHESMRMYRRRPGEGLQFESSPMLRHEIKSWRPSAEDILIYRPFGGSTPDHRELISTSLTEEQLLQLSREQPEMKSPLLEHVRAAIGGSPNLHIELSALDSFAGSYLSYLRNQGGVQPRSLAIFRHTDRNRQLWNDDRLETFFDGQIARHFVHITPENDELQSALAAARDASR